MIRWILIIVLAVWVPMGCTTHSQNIKGDQVYFFLKDPGIQTVSFASSLDGFQRHPLTRHTNKTWLISLPAKHEFTYFYIMDGQPFLPDCQYKEKDDFGSENCIFIPDL